MAWLNRTLPDVFYEEPEPPEDAMGEEVCIHTIKTSLWRCYIDRKDVFISNAVYINHNRTNGNARVRPDLFLAFDLDAEAIRQNLPNFWLWETGKAPDFVMEVASPSTADNDTGHKRDLYQRLGITEYWRFDPTGGSLYGQPLAGDRLRNGRYVPVAITAAPDGSEQAYSPLLNLNFHWSGAAFDVLDPATGKSLNRLADEIEARRAAEAMLSQEKARAERIEAERDAAQAEIARLRQQLRRRQPE